MDKTCFSLTINERAENTHFWPPYPVNKVLDSNSKGPVEAIVGALEIQKLRGITALLWPVQRLRQMRLAHVQQDRRGPYGQLRYPPSSGR